MLFFEFLINRCETILQPGDNCTVRIEKYTQKKKKKNVSKKYGFLVQNNVVYTCWFCSYENVMVGTSKGHVKNLVGSRAYRTSNETPVVKFVNTKPGSTPCGVLPTNKKREIDGSRSKPGNGSNLTSSKRRKKGWTNLKDIVASNELAKRSSFSNIVIPFKL